MKLNSHIIPFHIEKDQYEIERQVETQRQFEIQIAPFITFVICIVILLSILGVCAILVHRNIGKHSSGLDTDKTAALIPMPLRKKSISQS